MKQRHRKRRRPVRGPWSSAKIANITFVHSEWHADLALIVREVDAEIQELCGLRPGHLLKVDADFTFIRDNGERWAVG